MSSYVIAGASRGIGVSQTFVSRWYFIDHCYKLEFVRQLSQDPQNTVVGLARNPKDAISRFGDNLPTNATFIEADIVDHQSLKVFNLQSKLMQRNSVKLFQSAASKVESIVGGKLDYLINNGALVSKISAFKSLADL